MLVHPIPPSMRIFESIEPPPQEIPGVFNGRRDGRSVTFADLTGAAGITKLNELRTAIEEGRAYVNVHTSANPGGEIRGTLD